MSKIIKSNEIIETVRAAEKKLILSIEAAVGGGSLCLLENRTEIAAWNGTLEVSKVEELLEQTARLLRENRVAKNQIKLIGVSKDVGSSTGQKIGVALAKGLAKSFDCGLVEISVLEALLLQVRDGPDGDYLSVAGMGRNRLWWQLFELKDKTFTAKTSLPAMRAPRDFYRELDRLNFERVVFWSGVLTKDASSEDILGSVNKDRILFSRKSLAKLIGLKAAHYASDNEDSFIIK